MKPTIRTKKEMLDRLHRLAARDWYHYTAERLTKEEEEKWRAEKVEFNALREEYKATYGKLPNEVENWNFHLWN